MNKWLRLVVLCFQSLVFSSQPPSTRVLLGSPVAKRHAILREFLESLSHIKKKSFSLSYFFVDDNQDQRSSNLLQKFACCVSDCTIVKSWISLPPRPVLNNGVHFWDTATIRKVAEFKDYIIEYAIKNDYDYLFLIDADLLLMPDTIEHLVQCQKDIISEIFWTHFLPSSQNRWPNVWSYNVAERSQQLSQKLAKPGVYEVGGLGACTLISKHVLCKGIRFRKLKNLSFWGEDRHFCVRAAALGFKLFVDTHYPAFHIYFDSDLKNVDQFKNIHYKGLVA